MSKQGIVVGATKAGKEVAYRVPENESLYKVYLVGGGVVPASLLGGWTDARQVENAIKVFLARHDKTKPAPTGLKAAKKRPNKLTPKDK